MDDRKILLVIASAVQKASIDDPLLVPGISREQLVLTNEESDRKAIKVLKALRANNLNVVVDISQGGGDFQQSAGQRSGPVNASDHIEPAD
jgi:soluble P-type ATPase